MRRLAPLADLELAILVVVQANPGASSNAIVQSVRARRQASLLALRLAVARGLLRVRERPGGCRIHYVTRKGSRMVPIASVATQDSRLGASERVQAIEPEDAVVPAPGPARG